jgi:hypothetical protein
MYYTHLFNLTLAKLFQVVLYGRMSAIEFETPSPLMKVLLDYANRGRDDDQQQCWLDYLEGLRRVDPVTFNYSEGDLDICEFRPE